MQFSGSKETGASSRGGILESGAAAANEVDYEDVLTRVGFGKTQWILLLISGLLTITSLAAQTSLGIILIAAQCEFEMSQAEKGVMIGANVAGIFLSTYLWGYVSDAIGRRNVLLYTMFGTNILQFICMFITNVWLFNFTNFLIGICLGGISAAIYAYLSEFTTFKYRPIVINYSTMFVSISAIYVPVTAWWVLSANWSFNVFEGFVFKPWRLIMLLNLLPGFIGALMLLPFPESPKLLLSQSKEVEAVAAVEWISNFNTGRTVSSILQMDNYKLKPEPLANELGNHKGWDILVSIWRATVPLLHKPHRTNFVISAVAVFGLFFSANGMQIWYPEIVNRSSGELAPNSSTVCEILDASFARQMVNMTTSEESAICDDSISSQTYIDNIILGVVFVIGFFIQGLLLNPLGRKNVLMAAIGIGVVSNFLLHFVTNKTFILILFCLFILTPGLAISVLTGAVVDFVPTHLRGKAVSICFTLGRLGIIVSANLIGIMLEPVCNTTFAMFTVTLLIVGALVYRLPF